MLHITDEQFAAIGKEKKDDLIIKIKDVLCRKWDEAKAIPPDEFDASLAMQIERAIYYGLTSETNIVTYMVTGFLLGENFDSEFKATEHFLSDMTVDEDTKANALQQWSSLLFNSLEEPRPPAEDEDDDL